MRNSMHYLTVGIAAIALFSSAVGYAADTYTPTDFVTYNTRVLLPNHEPASNTTITLRSMSRSMLRGIPGYSLEPVVTDSDGRANLKVAARFNVDKHISFSIDPVYATVDPTFDHAGAIVLLNDSSHEDPLTIQIASGYTLRGKMETKDGDPFSSYPITINHDLHARSHTGYGGEIWKRETVTNANGEFVFFHVNPSPVTIKPKWDQSYYWSTTTINGNTMDDRIDEFQPEWGNLENHMVIQTSPSPAKTYQGIAVDQDGNPITGARVTIGYSWHREEKSYSDFHAWKTTNTLSDGSWRLEIPTEWVTWGSINQPGAPGARPGTAHIVASGKIDLSATGLQVVRLLPSVSDVLMPDSR